MVGDKMGIFKAISDFFKGGETKLITHELDQESVKTHNIIKGQANQIAELQGELARYKTKQSEQRQLQEQKQEEEHVKAYLQEDKKQLDKKNVQKFFSLKAFFLKYFNDKNFRNNLKYTTFDRSENLAKFGDFGFVGNSFVALDNKNRKILGTRQLKDLFQSIGALKNDISAFKIPINLDKDGGWVENIMVWDTPEIIKEDEGFRYSKAKRKPLFDLLKEKEAMVQQARFDLQEAEEAILQQQNKIDELEISSKANEESGEIARKERVKTIKNVSNIEKIFRDTETELTKMRQLQVIADDNITKLENQLKIMRDKAEGEETKLAFDKALEEVERIRSTIVRETPEKESEEVTEKKS